MSPMKLFEYMAAALGLNTIKKSMLQSATLQATSKSKACHAMTSTRVPTPRASTEIARSQATLGENELRRFVIDHGSFDSAENERIFEKCSKPPPTRFSKRPTANTVSPGSALRSWV